MQQIKSTATLMLSVVVAGWLSMSMTACTSTPKQSQSNHYYLLENSTLPSSRNRGKKTTEIALKPLNVPAYLTQNRLVIKGNSTDIIYANYHYWAETPKKAIHAGLMDRLNAHLTNPTNLTNALYTSFCRDCASVHVTIRSFYPTLAGDVVLSGFYDIKDADNRIIKQRPFHLTESLATGGYDESVSKMTDLLDELAHRIAQEW